MPTSEAVSRLIETDEHGRAFGCESRAETAPIAALSDLNRQPLDPRPPRLATNCLRAEAVFGVDHLARGASASQWAKPGGASVDIDDHRAGLVRLN